MGSVHVAVAGSGNTLEIFLGYFCVLSRQRFLNRVIYLLDRQTQRKGKTMIEIIIYTVASVSAVATVYMGWDMYKGFKRIHAKFVGSN